MHMHVYCICAKVCLCVYLFVYVMYIPVHKLDQLGLEVLHQILPAQVQYGRGLIAKLREAGEIVVFQSYMQLPIIHLSL